VKSGQVGVCCLGTDNTRWLSLQEFDHPCYGGLLTPFVSFLGRR